MIGFGLGLLTGESDFRRSDVSDRATTEYREVIRLKPDDALAHFNLGIALAAQGNLEEAIAEFR